MKNIYLESSDECATAADMYQCSREGAPNAFATIYEQKSGNSSAVILQIE
jgi:hypothetical protein